MKRKRKFKTYKSNPTLHLKVPYGLKKAAREANLWTSIKFYYQLKSLTIHGSFNKRGFVKYITYKLNISSKGAYINYNKLKKLGFIYEDESILRLVSYDFVWKYMNVLKEEKSRLKLMKVPLDDFEDQINLSEIQLNLKYQEKRVNENYVKHVLNLPNTEKTVKGKLKKLILRSFSEKTKEQLHKEQQNIIRGSLSSYVKHSWEITLTCEKIASILGYKSPMQGWHIAQDLKEKGFLNVTSRLNKPLYCRSNVTKEAFKALSLDSSFFLNSKKQVYKTLPNLITINHNVTN